jgi:ubiquinone/menaquinone biosynthesis C-methylase UbiE
LERRAANASLSGMTTQDLYVLGRSPAEYERLRHQARMWEPETTKLFDRVGLGVGDHCLDVGCGPGEAMRLMAERTASEGQVTGIDVDAALGAQALEMLRGAGHGASRFEPVDIESDTDVPGAPFDLVFARLLLTHVHDPVAVLRRLWGLVRPGGHLVVQDYDILSGAVVPDHGAAEECMRVARETMRLSGCDLRIGLRLADVHMRAGVGAPDGIEAGMRVAPLSELAPMFAAVYRSVLPRALELGVTTEAESERWLEDFKLTSGDAYGHTTLWPLLIGTWKRKPTYENAEAD